MPGLRERVRCRFVARAKDGHQFVPNLLVSEAQPAASFSGIQQHVQQIVVPLAGSAPIRDEAVEELVDGCFRSLECSVGLGRNPSE